MVCNIINHVWVIVENISQNKYYFGKIMMLVLSMFFNNVQKRIPEHLLFQIKQHINLFLHIIYTLIQKERFPTQNRFNRPIKSFLVKIILKKSFK